MCDAVRLVQDRGLSMAQAERHTAVPESDRERATNQRIV
jgi:hypothetical protein